MVDSLNQKQQRRVYNSFSRSSAQIAGRFFEIENDPEANKSFPYKAGEAARILLRRAKLYEDRARTPEGLKVV